MNLTQIISGAQTGADRAALDLAIGYQLPHGGWCPKGRRALDGPLDAKYLLTETPKTNYKQRTEWNVRDSDGTIIFTFAEALSGGSLKTMEFAQKHDKPCLHVNRSNSRPELTIQNFIAKHGIKVLNVAGSRESKEPGLYDWVKQILENALFWSDTPKHTEDDCGRITSQ
jgi:hypothetical protein